MKLDILVIVAHPDDAELSCGGTLIQAAAQGKKTGIIDLTRGELGTRGTPELRALEAAEAAKILKLAVRDNADLPDGFIANVREQQMRVIPYIRRYRPDIVITNAVHDRHPDHARASTLVSESCFLSGLKAIESRDAVGEIQAAWRPRAVYHIVQDRYLKPDFIVDISPSFEDKMRAVKAFRSQFYTGEEQKPEETTPISTKGFMEALRARALEYGRLINVEYGEGFTVERAAGLHDITILL